jgi:hypothetical protein
LEDVMIRTLSLTAAIALSIGAVAHAQTLPAYPNIAPLLASPRLSLSKPVDPAPLRYEGAPAPLPRGVAKTSVERREGGVTGAAGLLCGIQPSADDSGVGTARGYDKDGRFVGAKLAFSF